MHLSRQSRSVVARRCRWRLVLLLVTSLCIGAAVAQDDRRTLAAPALYGDDDLDAAAHAVALPPLEQVYLRERQRIRDSYAALHMPALDHDAASAANNAGAHDSVLAKILSSRDALVARAHSERPRLLPSSWPLSSSWRWSGGDVGGNGDGAHGGRYRALPSSPASQPAPLEDEAQLSTLTGRSLRRFLRDRGVDCSGCVERRDLVERAVAARGLPTADDALAPELVMDAPSAPEGITQAELLAYINDPLARELWIQSKVLQKIFMRCEDGPLGNGTVLCTRRV